MEFTPEMGSSNHPSDAKLKFKKKSEINSGTLTNMLENKARISINTKTGQHEFSYS